MATANFYLKSGSNTPEKLIYLFFSYHGKRLKYSTGQKVAPEYWNSDKQRVKETKRFPQYREFNAFLQNLENEAFNIYRRAFNDGNILSLNEFRNELDVWIGRGENLSKTTLFAFTEQFIEERKNSSQYAKGSIKVYQTVYNKLKEFRNKRRRNFDFEDIDFDFLEDLRGFLVGQGYSQNYIHKLLTTLRTVLNEATERGVNTHTKYKTKRFKVSKEGVKKIYLSVADLQNLFNLNLSKNSRLEKVRDLFLIGSFTGLRYSDFSQLRPENFRKVDGKEVIEVKTQKTGTVVVIPVHPFVRAIR